MPRAGSSYGTESAQRCGAVSASVTRHGSDSGRKGTDYDQKQANPEILAYQHPRPIRTPRARHNRQKAQATTTPTSPQTPQRRLLPTSTEDAAMSRGTYHS